MTNKVFLSECMLQSEKSVAYSTSFASEPYAGSATCQFTISTSESQGFSWNQDIFASQYQQLCKVIYDGHVDSVDKLLQKITPPGNHEENVYMDVFEAERGAERGAEYGQRFGPAEASPSRRGSNFDEWRSRMSRELSKPRRRSEQSISFASDSKNGTYRAADVVVIDVEAATPENMHFKELLS